MGQVIEFPERTEASKGVDKSGNTSTGHTGETAQVLLFTGIRYEREKGSPSDVLTALAGKKKPH